MVSPGPWAPCPVSFLLLLLPPLLPDARRVGHQGHDSKSERHSWRQGTGEHISCVGGYDLYLILDKSGSVNNDWMYVYNFAVDIVRNVMNPKLRLSLIIYATYGTTIMKLTSEMDDIEDGLNKLLNVKPQGATYMQEGFKRAIEQMELSNAGGVKVPTVIIAMTDGTLEPNPLKETVELANKVRSMGVTVYCVGVKEYKQEQLDVIADSKEHAIGVTGGFPALGSVTGELSKNSCIQIVSLEPSHVCAGEKYEVVIHGNGFHNAQNKEDVLCSFKFSDTNIVNENAITVEKNTVTCPGPVLEEAETTVFVEVSLNNGLNFLSNDLSITSTKCGDSFFSGFPDIRLLLPLVLSLLVLPVLLWCVWRLCCKPTIKEPPPLPPSQTMQSPETIPPPSKTEKPEEEEKMPPMKCPTIVFPCCGCPGVEDIRRMECKLDTLCTLVNQSCIQLSPFNDKGRCISLEGGMKYQCMQGGCCCPRPCPSPCQERKWKALPCCPWCHHPPPVHSQRPCRMLPLLRSHTSSLSKPPLALQPSVAPTLKH